MKTRLLAALTFIMLYINNPAAAQQWFRYKDFPVNIVPVDITANAAGTMFVLTNDSKIFYRVPGGTWTEMTSPFGNNFSLLNGKCIAADKSSNRIYVGTSLLGLYYTADLGATWGNTFLETNPVSGFHEGYTTLSNISSPDLFFAGTSNLVPAITKFTSLGTAGLMITYGSSPTSGPEALYYTSNQKLLIGASDGIWISQNNGTTITPTNLNTGRVYRFTEGANSRVYALRQDLPANTTSLVYSDDYMNWSTLALPNSSDSYTTLYYESATSTLWLGSKSGIYKMVSSSASWQNSNLNIPAPDVVELIGDNNGGMYHFNNSQVALKLNAGATSWNTINEGLRGDINMMAFNHNNKLFASKKFFTNQISTADAPAGSWNNSGIGSMPWGIHSITVGGTDTVFCTTSNKIYRSANNGLSFQATNLPPGFAGANGSITLFVKGEQNGIYVVNSSLSDKLFGSPDGGSTWSLVSGFESDVVDFSQDKNGHMFVVLFGASTEFQHQVFHSPDNGVTWTLLKTYEFFAAPFGSLRSVGTRTFLIDRSALSEIDLAATEPVVPINLPLPFSGAEEKIINAFRINSLGHLFLFSNELYKSVNNGLSWTDLGRPEAMPANDYIEDMNLAFDGVPFIIAARTTDPAKRGIYYFNETPLSIKGPHLKEELTIYPNPATDKFTLETSYKGNLVLVNLLGQPLKSAFINRKKTEIDISGMANGVYFIVLENGYTQKIVKQ